MPEMTLGEPAALDSGAPVRESRVPEQAVSLRDKYLTAEEVTLRQNLLDESMRLEEERHPDMSEQEHGMVLIRQQQLRQRASDIGAVAISRARQEAYNRAERGPGFLQTVKMAFGR